jgi:LacI family transcriptional regulator
VFAANDDSAIGVMFALTESGCHIPDDMAVIGFDDIPSARYQTPTLSTIHVPIAEMGRKAVETLVAAINDPDGYEPEIFSFKGILMARASTIGSRYVADADPPLPPLTGAR